jgi:tetratricopeptide (TPR) repeat protein
MRYSFVADHFQYLAGAALITAVVAAVAKALERMQPRTSETCEPRPMPYVLSAVVLAGADVFDLSAIRRFHRDGPSLSRRRGQEPGSWMANYNLGTALMAEASRTDEYEQPQIESMRDEAVARFETAVKLRPDHDRALNNWGLILLNRGKVDEAVEKFNEALKIAPKNISSLTNLARAMQRQKKYDQAMKLYRQALELAETDRTMTRGERAANQSTLQQFLAETYGAMGDVKQALGAFTHAVQLNSNNLEARLELGELLVRQNMLAEAATQYRAILRANPSHVPARVREAQLQIRVNNLRPAQANLDIAVRINPLAPQLQETVKIWSDAVEARLATTRAAATRPATTQAATQPSADIIARIDRLLREDITRMPATQPATTQAAPIGTTTLPSSIN